MKISYNWLKELLPDLTAAPEEVAQTLTMHSYETVVAQRWQIDERVQVVKIINIEPHPNADRLRLATVTDGHREIRVVCGAPNIAVGQVVPYAPPGTVVVGTDGQPFTITEAKIRGEQSPGMLNSARELGLGKDHSGILVLPEDTPLGTRLIDHLPNDVILEADITPNRAHDCLSHLGIARELAALLKLQVREPEGTDLPAAAADAAGFSLEDDMSDQTARYLGLAVQNTTNGASPLWMRARLWAAGAKPISLLVDITNYVLFETGQPSHVFDSARLPGKTIGVRPGDGQEKLRLLDEQEITPGRDDLVITSGGQAVALAGVMGGQGTEVGPDTSEVFVEVANFMSYPVQETARRWGLRTESSQRFAKGITPELVETAGRRLAYLITQLTGGQVAGRLDYYPHPAAARVAQLRPERISAVAGNEIDSDEAKDVLMRLGYTIDDTNTLWGVTIPMVRLDVAGEHDLIGEVIRMVGLENIPSRLSVVDALQPQLLPDGIYWREAIRDLLVDLGFTETLNTSFEPADKAELLGFSSTEHLVVTNPVAPELSQLRIRLLPGLLQNAAANRDDWHKKFSTQEKALFELGHVYHPVEDRSVRAAVPGAREELHLAGLLVGTKQMAENVIDEIRRLLDVESVDPVYVDDIPVATLKKLKYRVPLAAFEVNLTPLLAGRLAPASRPALTIGDVKKRSSQTAQYTPFSRFPSVLRDISLLVDAGISVEQVQELIERTGGELVVDTDLFDQYQPSNSGKQGFAFHIEYQAPDRTLTDEEVNDVQGRIIDALESDLSAEIR